jgi:type VI secretion system secreted protein VgrG
VEFLEGDPDKPIVTGCVYNGKNKVPYELPKHKTRSTFRTDTHKGRGFNELRFEDKKDEEEVRIHAQRDMNTVVRNDHGELVLGNKQSSVRHNQFTEIFGNELHATMGSVSLIVGAGHTEGVIADGLGSASNKISDAARKLTGHRMPVIQTVIIA